jgi:hypothetical protein
MQAKAADEIVKAGKATKTGYVRYVIAPTLVNLEPT